MAAAMDSSLPSSSKILANRRIVLKNYGGYDQLDTVSDADDRVLNLLHDLGAYQVLIKVEACGINFADLYTRQGLFVQKATPKPPFVMGREASGIIHQVGPDVTNFKVGDRIACISDKFGLWAEYVLVDSSECFALPDRMTFDEGAAFFINYLTAYFAVFDFGNLRAGQTIFVHSVAGGVGWAATQLALTVPDVIVVGTASASKAAAVKGNGVHHLIDSDDSDYINKVLTFFPQGVDVVLDNRSGIDFVHAQRLLNQMGRIVHLGANCTMRGEFMSTLNLLKLWWGLKHVSIKDLIMNNRAVCGFHLDVLRSEAPETVRRAADLLTALYDAGRITPNIDSVWTFDQVAAANRHLAERKNIGKVIMKP